MLLGILIARSTPATYTPSNPPTPFLTFIPSHAGLLSWKVGANESERRQDGKKRSFASKCVPFLVSCRRPRHSFIHHATLHDSMCVCDLSLWRAPVCKCESACMHMRRFLTRAAHTMHSEIRFALSRSCYSRNERPLRDAELANSQRLTSKSEHAERKVAQHIVLCVHEASF